MFSNIAYEALYTYLGLKFHEIFIEIITSEPFFKGLAILIFGVIFVVTVVKIFSRYVPGVMLSKSSLPLTKAIKVIFLLFFGLSLLRVDARMEVKDYSRKSWHSNPYILDQVGATKESYRVSFIFDLLSRTAEELAALLSRVVDQLMAKTHSQLDSPNFFYKSIIYSGIATIEDPELQESLSFFTQECIEKVLPQFARYRNNRSFFDKIFSDDGDVVDDALKEIPITSISGTNCLDVKNEVNQKLSEYAKAKIDPIKRSTVGQTMMESLRLSTDTWDQLTISSQLVNHYLDERENHLGIARGSKVPGTTSVIFQYLNRLKSWDGFLSLTGNKDKHGSAEASERSKRFSEHLMRAPHIAGIIKMFLIALFPWLFLFVIAGKWKVLVIWFTTYCSVLLWTPLWTWVYHIMVNIALSADLIEAFGKVGAGVSLYGAKLINSKIYYMFSVFSWVQILIGTVVTGSTLYFLRPMLTSGQEESAPEFVESIGDLASTAAKKAVTKI